MSELEDFLALIFPPDLIEPDDNILYLTSKGKPGYPCTAKKFATAAKRSKHNMYINTGTVVPNEEGVLFARGRQFAGAWALALDDVGTGIGAKCHRDDVQAVWDAATYRIETSPGNYQLGFVYAEPIRDYNQASELVKIVYGAGEWDSGGALALKWVRCPVGYNNKEKYQDDKGEPFKCRLDYISDVIWTPDELLDLVNAGVGWQDIVDGTADRRDPRRTRGTTPYRGGATYDMAGVVDPVLEWMEEQGWVRNIRYPWADIVCPNAENHTSDSDSSTSYSPLGWGELESDKAQRGFSCLHGHCTDINTREFLERVNTDHHGPLCSVFDPLGKTLARWVLDSSRQRWVDIKSPHMTALKDAGFKLHHSQKFQLLREGQNPIQTKEYEMIVTNPGLLRVSGSKYEPGGDLIIEENGEKFINDCRIPHYGKGPVVQKDVDTFLDFIYYLFPREDHGDWFIRHLAMKVQDPQWRGPAIFMYSPTQGTGRTTLGDMLAQLWGTQQVMRPSMTALIAGINGGSGTFNVSLRTLWIMIDEAKDGGSETPRAERLHYEALKKFISPTRINMRYEEKNAEAWHDWNYSSVIIASNHADGLKLDMEDRRFKRLPNTLDRRSADYFNTLYAWLATDWTGSVWRYLEQYDCGDYTGMEPQNAALTEEELDQRLLSQSPLEFAMGMICEYARDQSQGVVRGRDFDDVLNSTLAETGLGALRDTWRLAVPGVLRSLTSVVKHGDKPVQVRAHGGTPVRVRCVNSSPVLAAVYNGSMRSVELKAAYEAFDMDACIAYVRQRAAELRS